MNATAKKEIVKVLDAVWEMGREHLELKIHSRKENLGWGMALANVADKLGVTEEYTNFDPAKEA